MNINRKRKRDPNFTSFFFSLIYVVLLCNQSEKITNSNRKKKGKTLIPLCNYKRKGMKPNNNIII